MKLTEQELQWITPGIYRGWGCMEPPNLNNAQSDEFIAQLRRVKNEQSESYPNFYASPQEFLQAWLYGYRDFPETQGEHPDRSFLSSRAKGFELYYINWHPEHKHYVIAGQEGTFAEGKRFNRLLLASDINGMNDQSSYMNIGINDLAHERVLVWRGVVMDDIGKPVPYGVVWSMEKRLRDDQHFYIWKGRDRFPFDSPNTTKAGGAEGLWTLIGIEPEEVYEAFKKQCNVVFPEPDKSI